MGCLPRGACFRFAFCPIHEDHDARNKDQQFRVVGFLNPHLMGRTVRYPQSWLGTSPCRLSRTLLHILPKGRRRLKAGTRTIRYVQYITCAGPGVHVQGCEWLLLRHVLVVPNVLTQKGCLGCCEPVGVRWSHHWSLGNPRPAVGLMDTMSTTSIITSCSCFQAQQFLQIYVCLGM